MFNIMVKHFPPPYFRNKPLCQAEVKKARTDCEASGQKRIAFETFLPIYLSVQVFR